MDHRTNICVSTHAHIPPHIPMMSRERHVERIFSIYHKGFKTVYHAPKRSTKLSQSLTIYT